MGLNLSDSDAAQLNADIERWAQDPVAFVLEVFGPRYEEETGDQLVIDRWQEKGLRGLVRHDPHGACDGSPHKRVAAKACKGPGKTAWKAWIGWWLLLTRRYSKGIAVSITGDNLKTNLWTELSTWQRRSPLLTALFEHTAEAIRSRDHKEWKLEARAFPQDADKGRQAETLAGLHAESVFVLLDEVGSFPQGVLDAAQAIFNVKGQDAVLVVGGNATSVDGALFRICTEEAERWLIIEITGDPDDPDRSPRLDIDEAREQIRLHGRGDPVVMVNWLGKFPPRGGNKLLGPDDVSKAMKRDCPERIWRQEARVWGLDPAGEGLDPDEATLYKRQGPVCFQPSVWRNLKTDALADRVAWEYHEAKKKQRHPKKIFVDKGGVGRGTYDRLHTLLGGDIIVGVDFGENALDETQFSDRRTEMWCLAAGWVRDRGCLPEIPELRRDLTAPSIGVESTTSNGTRRIMESKKAMKKRGLPSPDHGDGFALTFAAPVLADAMDEVMASHRSTAQTKFDPYEFMLRRR